jgi:nucleoside-diphosphate-sugar epimerase
MDIHDYIVVGSGCSGAIVAQTLVDRGAKVTMLDVGIKDDVDYKVPNEDFVDLRKNDAEQYRYLIGNKAEGISWGKVGSGAQITPPRKYILNLVDRYANIASSSFSAFQSLGYGGMGIGWSLQSWEYTKDEVQAMGLDNAKMRRAYSYLAEKIGLCASDNDATRIAVGDIKAYQPAPKMDRNNSYTYKKYLANKKSLNKKGIIVGQTPLALLTRDKGERKKYSYSGMDFYADKGKSAWRPWITIEQLKKKPNFNYIDGHLVLRFEEKKDVTLVHCLKIDDDKPVTFKCHKLILGASAIGSARIVLRSFNDHETKLPLLSNLYTYVPCIQPGLVGKEAETKKLAYSQLSIFLDKETKKEESSMASLHSYQSLMLFRIINQAPFNLVDSRILMRYLSSGLFTMGIYHPDGPAKNKYLQLEKDEESPNGDVLKIHFAMSSEEKEEFKNREKRFMKAARKLGMFPLKRVDPGLGSGIHYGGTLPFSENEAAYSLSPTGRLHKTKSVFVADSSGFKYLPAPGPTFSLMANAYLVAEEVLKEENLDMSQSRQQTIAITGANGFLGAELVKSFKDDGWKVIALVRDAKKHKTPGVTFAEYDLSKPFDDSVLAGADYLVHTAYVKYDAKNPDALKVNVEGAKRLLAASRKHKLKRNIFMSSMGAHSGTESIYGKQKMAVEKVFTGKDCTVIRSGLIIGDGGIVKQMTGFMKSKHAAPLIGGGKQPLQVVAVYDLIRVIKAIIAKNKSGTLTIATPEIYTYKKFYQSLIKRLGTVVIFVPIPLEMLAGAIKLTTTLRLPLAINQENVLGLKSLKSAETAEDLKSIGIKLDDLDQILSKSKL